MNTIDNNLVCVGKIISPHGIKGNVKICSFTEDPFSLFSYPSLSTEDGSKQFKTEMVSSNNQNFVARIEGITNRNDAEALRGTELYIPKDLLPELEEDEFYYNDLMGLVVQDEQGTALGTIKAVFNFGASDMIEVSLTEGSKKTVMFPFTKEIVPVINIKEGYVTICPPDEHFIQPDEQAEDDEQ